MRNAAQASGSDKFSLSVDSVVRSDSFNLGAHLAQMIWIIKAFIKFIV